MKPNNSFINNFFIVLALAAPAFSVHKISGMDLTKSDRQIQANLEQNFENAVAAGNVELVIGMLGKESKLQRKIATDKGYLNSLLLIGAKPIAKKLKKMTVRQEEKEEESLNQELENHAKTIYFLNREGADLGFLARKMPHIIDTIDDYKQASECRQKSPQKRAYVDAKTRLNSPRHRDRVRSKGPLLIGNKTATSHGYGKGYDDGGCCTIS